MQLRTARVAAVAALLLAVACDSEERPALRLSSESYTFLITPEPLPPYSVERVVWNVTVRDRDSRQPIEGGEGRLYASTIQRVTVWDGLARGAELGSYSAAVMFPTAGQWGMAIEFRSDSTQALEKVEWQQEVGAERSVDEQLGNDPGA
ncbi:MAG TPA: hypothetical protein VKZ41_13975 [Gemmatimonadales bacterium]|nr:hypothetical protein [Gemmatimonadales bacterium]